MNFRILRATGLLLLVGAITACGNGGKAELSGKVTYKGTPLTFGEVQVKGSDGVIVSGQINSDGTYTVQGVARGSCQVAITAVDEKASTAYFLALAGRGNGGDPIGPDGKPRPKGGPALDRSAFSKIPTKYGEFNTANLTVDVKDAKATKNFDLD
jgi:hypothetical protein